ncbi:unnamed protein product [Trifolium pratense]|uniref:Uncharacterized protein n=1 Tax=Trifolium pratense TaxID=57577 RepID=A0ACB0J0S9_TRIPR|nr:unnamed protein product [Trifolium pratense]
MIILSWNCRGLGGPSAIPNLRKLAREHKPDILFLSETLSHARHLEPIRVTLGYDSCLAIDVEGQSGGLAVFWKDNSKCRVLNYTRNFINLLVEDEKKGEWRLTCYYGYPERSRRRHAWNLLRELVNMSPVPWCIIGDFNDLLSQEDKKGIHPHPNWLCMVFRQAINDCNLIDIPLAGHPFTWIKSRGTPHVIEERLDRAMASTSWLHLFPDVRLFNLLASHSDHSPILLQCSPTITVRFNGSFRFENKWLKEPDLEETVIDGWGANDNIAIVNRVARCANKLQRHATLLVQEEGYWKQRAKMHWLQEGDLNTRFFHMSVSARSKKKKITKLVDEAGTAVHTQEDLCEVAKNYFNALFKNISGIHVPVLNHIQQRVTEEDNHLLMAPMTKIELQQALFQMHPDKSPGPDGFNPAFYQRFWEHCGDDIFVAASSWLDRGYFPSSLNETNICLIPKCDNPTLMKDLRHISLCNVLYKIVSKVLANRLKFCLDKCVSQEQSAFVEGRSILDNALISIEVIHAMKRKTRGYRGELALKIDISKAYDKVDWGFLRVLMNFDKDGPITLRRGLRQGDSLSPYLFILVAEGLTALIHQAVRKGDIHGVRICRGAPEVSHLLFADDCFLFCRANVAEVTQLLSILHTYEQASGQKINLSKSEVFISRNMSQTAQADLVGILGVRHVLGTSIYLGLPSMVGRNKKTIFSYIKDRIWKRINSWRGRALSKAGKEIMIKLVLQAIPAYVMSMFILPSSFIDDIEKMINAFWWGGGNGNSKAWERLACPKDKGGLGFRNFEAFNMAMVAKQAWNILQNPDTLVARLIKARYFPRSNLFEASLGYNPSFAWRSICKARQVLLLGCRWRIGGGDMIHVMSDPWLHGNGECWVPSPQAKGMYNLFVRDLMIDNYKAWNVTKIRMSFPVQVAERIIATPLIGSVYVGKMIWEEERNGCYSVKSGYKLAMKCIFRNDKYHVEGNWKEILWKAHAPHKARHLLWRLCRGCIPTRRRLLERYVDCDVHCPLCEDEVEDDVHAFFTSVSAQSSWQAAGLSSVLGSAACQHGSAAERVFALCQYEDYATIGRVATLLWSIWHNRNDKIWNDNVRSPNQIGRAAFDHWNEWFAIHKLRSNDDHDVPLVSTNRIGWLKCNVDAAFFVGAGRTAMGACFHNNSGEFMDGITQWQQLTLSTEEGEACTLLQAMNEAKSRGFESVQFESDSQVLVDAIRTKRRGNSEFLSIVNEIILVMLSCVNLEVKFIRRQVNSVAHTLARAANSWTSFHRFEIIPSCIEFFIINEM